LLCYEKAASFLNGHFIFYTGMVVCQDVEVPADYTLLVGEGYARYEKDIIAAARWLVSTAPDEQEAKHREVPAFVVGWVNGSSTVNGEINALVAGFDKKTKACPYYAWQVVQDMCLKKIIQQTCRPGTEPPLAG
jgi:hypothetical protein